MTLRTLTSHFAPSTEATRQWKVSEAVVVVVAVVAVVVGEAVDVAAAEGVVAGKL